MGVIAYLAAVGVFLAVALWCWVTETFTFRRVGFLVMLTITQALLAIYIDYPIGLVIAAIFVGIEIFILVDLYERPRFE
jgi:hypothetical protein